MNDAENRLLVAVLATAPEDGGVASCWHLVVNGVRARWIDEDDLVSLIGHLRSGRDYGVEELFFDHIGDRLRVSFLDETVFCDPAALRTQLERLRGCVG